MRLSCIYKGSFLTMGIYCVYNDIQMFWMKILDFPVCAGIRGPNLDE